MINKVVCVLLFIYWSFSRYKLLKSVSVISDHVWPSDLYFTLSYFICGVGLLFTFNCLTCTATQDFLWGVTYTALLCLSWKIWNIHGSLKVNLEWQQKMENLYNVQKYIFHIFNALVSYYSRYKNNNMIMLSFRLFEVECIMFMAMFDEHSHKHHEHCSWQSIILYNCQAQPKLKLTLRLS